MGDHLQDLITAYAVSKKNKDIASFFEDLIRIVERKEKEKQHSGAELRGYIEGIVKELPVEILLEIIPHISRNTVLFDWIVREIKKA